MPPTQTLQFTLIQITLRSIISDLLLCSSKWQPEAGEVPLAVRANLTPHGSAETLPRQLFLKTCAHYVSIDQDSDLPPFMPAGAWGAPKTTPTRFDDDEEEARPQPTYNAPPSAAPGGAFGRAPSSRPPAYEQPPPAAAAFGGSSSGRFEGDTVGRNSNIWK